MPIIPFPVGAICSVCGKRKATKMCDFPVGKCQYIGHPPRHLMQQAQNANVAWQKVEMSKTITCDKLLCDECAIQMGNGIDFCPVHISDMQIKKTRGDNSG